MKTSRMIATSIRSMYPTFGSQFPKHKILNSPWHGWSPDNTSLNIVAVKASNPINCKILHILNNSGYPPGLNVSPSCSDMVCYRSQHHTIYIVRGGSKNLFSPSFSRVYMSHLVSFLADSHQTFLFLVFSITRRPFSTESDMWRKET
jgi:hypothetical protein